MKKRNSFIIFLSFIISFSIISPVQAKETETIKHVEAFSIPILDPDTGFESGYKKVNSITLLNGDTNSLLEVIVKSVEDYYDNAGKFVESVVTYNEASNNYSTGKIKSRISEAKFNEPKTNIVADVTDIKESDFAKSSLNVATTNQISKNIENHVSKLEIPKEFIERQGVTSEQIEKINDFIEQERASNIVISPFSSEAAGAFDNYYNHNTSTGNYTVQALVGHRFYLKVTGTTLNKPKNASALASYKTLINDYERTVIEDMEGANWTEVASWAFAISSGVVLAATAAGPAGWIAAFSVWTLAEMVIFFGSLTTTIYSTVQRTSLSKVAAQKVRSAYLLAWDNTKWDTLNFEFVSGY